MPSNDRNTSSATNSMARRVEFLASTMRVVVALERGRDANITLCEVLQNFSQKESLAYLILGSYLMESTLVHCVRSL